MPLNLANIINPRRLAAGMVIEKAKQYAATLCDGLGPERIRWMIEHDQPLGRFVTETMIAGIFEIEVADLAILRREWGWTVRAVTDQEFRTEVLPAFVQELVKERGEQGDRWCAELVAWLRKEIGG